ncbi:MAG TPA: DUF4126 domain-containing protein [Candidatus Omnitrophica bacterium]|nr:DUF4126 domain-containing protein [Candidatus Omnitrophota bacterium]
MEVLNSLGIVLGSSWSSGVNLYMTVAGLGILGRIGAVSLPANMDVISHPLVIGVAVLMYLVEFFADKIPYVDSAWDSVHTAIRPLGGAVLAYMATSGYRPCFTDSCRSFKRRRSTGVASY